MSKSTELDSFSTVFWLQQDALNNFTKMWYHVFLWALFSSIFVHTIAALIAFLTLRKHKFGKFFPILILLMGVLPPITSGIVSSAVIAFVYKSATYSVIEFSDEEGGGVAIVHCKWFTPRKKEVFWPPYKDPNAFNRALIKGVDVSEDWKLFKINRNFYETDDLEKAKRKLKLSELTSDLNTDAKKNFLLGDQQRSQRRIIESSLKFTIPQITEKEVEDAIKTWLKHAPEHYEKEIE
ncbi:hypothetical protein RN001_009458 [Aquatica leii]|uniref:Uncharacterized protein n=1 Tax=Aquatica leii TaxID=1421715 RepID=A0AAN7PVF3_9COLE|nr:hypothetical protein RN001_009458 [Aquatica leii]